MSKPSRIKIIFFTKSYIEYLVRRDFVFEQPVDFRSISIVAPISYVTYSSADSQTLSVRLPIIEVYQYFAATNFQEDLAYDVYYGTHKLIGIDVYADSFESVIIDYIEDLSISLYKPSLSHAGNIEILLYKPDISDADGKNINTSYPSSFFIETPYPPITISLFHPQPEYGFVLSFSLAYPQLNVTDVNVLLYYPKITASDVNLTLYAPLFVGIQDISLDGEPIPFMFGYETSIPDGELIFEEYEITLEDDVAP